MGIGKSKGRHAVSLDPFLDIGSGPQHMCPLFLGNPLVLGRISEHVEPFAGCFHREI